MSELVDKVIERRDSKVTIASSFAADLVNQSATQNNMSLDGNQTIHVGDVINNFYTPPPGETSNSDSSFQGSVVDYEEILPPKILYIRKAFRFVRRRKYWLSIYCSIVIGLSVWLSIVLFTQNPTINIPETTSEIPISTESTTTTSASTTELTTTTTEKPINLFSRDDWSRGEVKNLSLPIKKIIVAHTADQYETCNSVVDCKSRVRMIQWRSNHLNDIPFNFLIGGDGSVFEGRGFEYEGEHTANNYGSSFNDIGICVAFIGTFNETQPTLFQIEAFHNFTMHFINEGVLIEDHKIFFQDQLSNPNVSADALLAAVKDFEKFHSVSKIFLRDEWNSIRPTKTISPIFAPIERVVLTQTDLLACTTFTNCLNSLRIQQSIYNAPMGDIAFNFIIGGTEGFVFEGRGFNRAGMNKRSHETELDALHIAFIGNFKTNPPLNSLIDTALKFLEDALALGKLSANYRIGPTWDFDGVIDPGEELMKIVRTWPRYLNIG